MTLESTNVKQATPIKMPLKAFSYFSRVITSVDFVYP